MARAWRQYAVLALLFACAASYQTGNLTYLVTVMRHPAEFPSAPFSVMIATRTIGSGPLSGDQILSIDGKPFTSARQYYQTVYDAHPGDELQLVLSEPSGRAIEKSIEIGNEAPSYQSASQLGLTLCVNFLIPLVGLALGFGVAFIRPRDRNAWL